MSHATLRHPFPRHKEGRTVKKLTVFAMTEKGYAVVSTLISRYPAILDTVVAARDKNMAEDCFDKIADLCRRNGIRFCERAQLKAISTEYALAVSWRWMINPGPSRLIVFHDSLLPKYRGFNPLVTALLNGDEEVGVTALFATAEYDRGDIIAQSACRLTYPIRIRDVFHRITANFSSLAVGIGECLTRGEMPVGVPQDDSMATYSLWRDDEDYFIDWARSAKWIRRFVDSVGFPYKGAAAVLDDHVVRILDAEEVEDVVIANRTPGKVIYVRDAKPVVVCGSGLLRINELVADGTGTSLLPLARFRLRFK
jgi:methionyl-tRNA formyltransferase